MAEEWDVAITGTGSSVRGDNGQITVPAAIMRSLSEHGMNRARMTVTKQGLLLRPYKGIPARQRTKQSVELPFAS